MRPQSLHIILSCGFSLAGSVCRVLQSAEITLLFQDRDPTFPGRNGTSNIAERLASKQVSTCTLEGFQVVKQ